MVDFHDPALWVAIGTVVFVAAVFKPIKKVMITGLDKRSGRIGFELAEAKRLKEEALSVLTMYQRKQKATLDESKEIIAHAKQEAERIVAAAKEQIEVDIARRTELALAKIAQAESQVIQEIRHNAIDITVSAARALIIEHLTKESAEALIGSAISDIDRKFH